MSMQVWSTHSMKSRGKHADHQFFGKSGGRTVWIVRAHHPRGNQTGSVKGHSGWPARAHHPHSLRRLPQWKDRQQQGRRQVSTTRLLTLIEVADMLRVSPHTVRAWTRKGRL